LHWFVSLSIRRLLADKRRGCPTGANLEALAVTDLGIVVEDKQQVTNQRTPGDPGSCHGAAATAAAAAGGSGGRGDAVQGRSVAATPAEAEETEAERKQAHNRCFSGKKCTAT
jgi:hypothetical protein